jgi:hypothetical protein
MQEEGQEAKEARERGPKRIERDYQRATPSYMNLEGPRAIEYEKAETRSGPSGGLMLESAAIGRREFARITGFHDSDSESRQGWVSVGPVNAIYPSTTSRTNAPYVASGRISALAIDPRCGLAQAAKSDDREDRRCRLYIGAARGRHLAYGPPVLEHSAVAVHFKRISHQRHRRYCDRSEQS